MRYLVKIYHFGGNYSAMAPDLPGCVAAADSVEETIALMTDALALHLESMRRSHEKIPQPTKRFDIDVDEFEDEELCTWIDVPKTQKTKKATNRRKSVSAK